DPDFPRTLGDRHQHDVHDADSADEQAHASQSAEHAGHDLSGARHRVGDLGHVANVKIIFLVGAEATGITQDVLYAGDGLACRNSVLNGNVDLADVAISGDATLKSRERHHYHSILILTEARRAFRFQNANDATAQPAHAD